MVWYGIGLVWYGLVWHDLVWYGFVWFRMVWFGYGLVWFDMVWHGTAWYGLVRPGMVCNNIKPYLNQTKPTETKRSHKQAVTKFPNQTKFRTKFIYGVVIFNLRSVDNPWSTVRHLILQMALSLALLSPSLFFILMWNVSHIPFYSGGQSGD